MQLSGYRLTFSVSVDVMQSGIHVGEYRSDESGRVMAYRSLLDDTGMFDNQWTVLIILHWISLTISYTVGYKVYMLPHAKDKHFQIQRRRSVVITQMRRYIHL